MSKLMTAIRHPRLAVSYALSKVPDLSVVVQRRGAEPPIQKFGVGATRVDDFWADHTVIGSRLAAVKTAAQDKRYLQWRFDIYPFFKEFMGLWGNHEGEVIVDFGCGPGNDLVGFLTESKAKKVIGIDISAKALKFASWRLSLHNVNVNRVGLIQISDSATKIPLESNSVDYVYCEGVLHHTSNPSIWLREFHRILKPNSEACVMVYNHDSVFLHLYVAYELMVLQRKYSGMSVEQAFAKSTDTEDCPISRCYKPADFLKICRGAGFNAQYVGGYLSDHELHLLKEKSCAARQDERLTWEHITFLRELDLDTQGFPKYHGKYAGVGGVYKLVKGEYEVI